MILHGAIVRSFYGAVFIQQNTTGGNVRTAVSYRLFHPGSRIVYNGTSPQYMGNTGASTGPGTTTIIDNVSGITVVSSTTLSGDLNLKQGDLFISGTNSLTLGGMIYYGTGAIDGAATSALVITGSSGGPVALLTKPGSPGFGTLTLDRTGPSASLTLLNELHICSQLNLVNSNLVNPGLLYFDNGVTLSRWPEGYLLLQPPGITPGDRYNITYRSASTTEGPFANFQTGLELPASPDILGILEIDLEQGSDTVALVQDIVVEEIANWKERVTQI